MKKLLITAMALSCFALSYGQKKVEKHYKPDKNRPAYGTGAGRRNCFGNQPRHQRCFYSALHRSDIRNSLFKAIWPGAKAPGCLSLPPCVPEGFHKGVNRKRNYCGIYERHDDIAAEQRNIHRKDNHFRQTDYIKACLTPVKQQDADTCNLNQFKYHAGRCCRSICQQEGPSIKQKGQDIHNQDNPGTDFQAFGHQPSPPAISPRK